ncbi:MAG: phosphohistidine phosphatase SixA [Cyanobacteria bacterium P01_D01_bin.6]
MALSPQTELYFIRHGIAAERGIYEHDGDRPLTERGQSRTQAVAKRLVQVGCCADLILASPLVRAQQTAEVLLKAELAQTFETADLLSPGGHLADWLPWLTGWQTDQPTSRLALIGHEPDLTRWAQQLVHGMWGDRWQLKKAGVIGVEVPAAEAAIGRSELFWLAPPRLLL